MPTCKAGNTPARPRYDPARRPTTPPLEDPRMLKPLLSTFALAVAFMLAGSAMAKDDVIKAPTDKPADKTPLAGTVKDIDGKDVSLADYKGKVVLIVNVASKCGNTPQYKPLEAMYEKYKDQGFVILGFPANDFGKQEPGSNDQIKAFCSETYKVAFPMFAKITVKGDEKAPIYKFLTEPATNGDFAGEI